MHILSTILTLFLTLNIFSIGLTDKPGKLEYKDMNGSVIVEHEFITKQGVKVIAMNYDTTRGIQKLSLTVDLDNMKAIGECDIKPEWFNSHDWMFEAVNKDTYESISAILQKHNVGEFRLRKGWNRFDFRSHYGKDENATLGVDLIDVVQVWIP
jgi:hypothetical protein